MAEPLKVIINAQLVSGYYGGIEQFLIGLVSSLGKLTDGPEEYLIITSWEDPHWLSPYLGPNQRIISAPKPGLTGRMRGYLRPFRTPLLRLRRQLQRFIPYNAQPKIPISDGFLESFGAALVHFPYQQYIRCQLPSIYTPHDLQHRHYPEFYTPDELAMRESIYTAGCHESDAIIVESHSAKEDIIEQYEVEAGKIQEIRCGAPTELYSPVSADIKAQVSAKYHLPEQFAFYPAQTWRHKNHLGLLEAIARLRDTRQYRLSLVCAGRQNDFFPVIQQHIDDLHLRDQVQFLGFVSETELRTLYQLSTFIVFPSLFEGAGLPVLEAFREGKAIACSNVTSLPEYGGEAVLTFEPGSVEAITEALRRMATDEALRETLQARGTERIQLFTWERMGRTVRALYRKVAGRQLTAEDCQLLEGETHG